MFWKFFAGKYPGDKLEKSFRFKVYNYIIHIHHWIWSFVLLLILFALNINSSVAFGLLIGSIIQGLTYKDRFIMIYKDKDFEKIYSKFRK